MNMDRNQPLALANADEVIEGGWIVAENGVIAAFGRGAPPAKAEDMGGDLVIPGLVELHTDHIEAHYMPRPKVHWDPLSAVVSYDAQLATCGITTVLDSLRVWREEGADDVNGEAALLAAAIATARDGDLLRITHYLHLRCEVPMPQVVEEASELIGRGDVRLVSLMDHTPGQRQFRDEQKLCDYYRGKSGRLTDAELDAMFDQRREQARRHATPNYRDLVGMAHARGIPLVSHDDTTAEHVARSIADASPSPSSRPPSRRRRHSMPAGCGCSWAHPISSAAAPIPATSRPRIWRGRACSMCCPRTTCRQAS
jgi:alpha-D-ribose 1-methylphosphonate 5-triphosphate diphosphatase